jgi:stage II sporulation protein GA (sporulation sigma-E factor processing peptidase)
MNYIILFATGIIVRSPLKIIRTLISSILGSIYAIVSYMSILEIYSSLFLKIILSLAMVYIAFGSKSPKLFFKQLIIFYLTSFTFGGVAFAFLYFISPENILMENRSVSRNISNKSNFNSRHSRVYHNYNII